MTSSEIANIIESGGSLQFVMTTDSPDILGTIYLKKGPPPAIIGNELEPEARMRLIRKARQAAQEGRLVYYVSLIHTPRQLIATGDPRFEQDYRVLAMNLLDTIPEVFSYLRDKGFDLEKLELWDDVLPPNRSWQPFPPNPMPSHREI